VLSEFDFPAQFLDQQFQFDNNSFV
jgi:hypothetical protein